MSTFLRLSVLGLGILTLVLSLMGAQGTLAYHASAPGAIDSGSRTCVGSHCTIIDWWSGIFNLIDAQIGGAQIDLHATLTMDTALRAPITGIAANCSAGETITIPIDASGEIIGAGEAFYDSPPIHFLPNGVVRAIVDGLSYACKGTRLDRAHCDELFTHPIEGTWADSWTVTGGNVQCSTNTAGTLGTCTIPPGTQGNSTVSLTRAVDNPTWKHFDAVANRELVFTSWLKRNDSTGKPYATMTSSAQINCPPPAAPNLSVTATSLLPAAPAHDDPLSLNATIQNSGTGPAGASVSRLRFDENVTGTWNVGPFDVNSAALVVNGTVDAPWIGIWAAPGGTHRLQVCADATNVVAESNEADNCREVVFTVKQPALACAPGTQAVNVEGAATLAAAGGNNSRPFYRWIANGASPESGNGVSFSTSWAAAGTKTVGVVEHYVDVNGDGFMTAFDAQAVMNNIGKVEAGNGARWQNPANRFDVNGDGVATRIDAQIANDYGIAQGTGALPTVNCAVTVEEATTTPTEYDAPPLSMCTPAVVNVAINEAATFQYATNSEVRWDATGGNPFASEVPAREFTTRYAAAGTYTVKPAPLAYYDVNGDGYATPFDFQAVAGKLLDSAKAAPALTGSTWQNTTDPFDVNSDGTPSPLDALIIVNYLNRFGAGLLPLTSCTVTVAPGDTLTGVGPTAAFDVPATVTLSDTITAVSTSRPGTCPGTSCGSLNHLWTVKRVIDGVDVTPSANTNPTVAVPGDQVSQYQFTLKITDPLTRENSTTKFVVVVELPQANHEALCAPAQQTATQNTPVHFDSALGETGTVWSAPDGVPNSGTGASFSTSFATTGAKVVRVAPAVPPYLDVNGDGSVTTVDRTEVITNIGKSAPGSSSSPWQNKTNRFDVNNDGSVTPQGDVLRLGNYLTEVGQGPLPALECRVTVEAGQILAPPTTGGPVACPPPGSPVTQPFYDVDGNGFVEPADAEAITGPNLTGLGNGSASWQNQANRFDVNNDGQVSPTVDRLLIVNYLNAGHGGRLPVCTVGTPTTPTTPTTPGTTTGNPFIPGPIRETE